MFQKILHKYFRLDLASNKAEYSYFIAIFGKIVLGDIGVFVQQTIIPVCSAYFSVNCMSRLIATNLHRIQTPAMTVRVEIPFLLKARIE